METLEAIFSRRTRRFFEENRPLEKQDLFTILKAGVYAPSGMNSQPWHFSVVLGKSNIDRLENKILELRDSSLSATPSPLRGAPCVVVISVDRMAVTPVLDVGCAAENMLLAATDLGIASCWCNAACYLQNDEEIREFLRVPKDYTIITSLMFGYSKENPIAHHRRTGMIDFITE